MSIQDLTPNAPAPMWGAASPNAVPSLPGAGAPGPAMFVGMGVTVVWLGSLYAQRRNDQRLAEHAPPLRRLDPPETSVLEEQLETLKQEIERLSRSNDPFDQNRARVLRGVMESLQLVLGVPASAQPNASDPRTIRDSSDPGPAAPAAQEDAVAPTAADEKEIEKAVAYANRELHDPKRYQPDPVYDRRVDSRGFSRPPVNTRARELLQFEEMEAHSREQVPMPEGWKTLWNDPKVLEAMDPELLSSLRAVGISPAEFFDPSLTRSWLKHKMTLIQTDLAMRGKTALQRPQACDALRDFFETRYSNPVFRPFLARLTAAIRKNPALKEGLFDYSIELQRQGSFAQGIEGLFFQRDILKKSSYISAFVALVLPRFPLNNAEFLRHFERMVRNVLTPEETAALFDDFLWRSDDAARFFAKEVLRNASELAVAVINPVPRLETLMSSSVEQDVVGALGLYAILAKRHTHLVGPQLIEVFGPLMDHPSIAVRGGVLNVLQEAYRTGTMESDTATFWNRLRERSLWGLVFAHQALSGTISADVTAATPEVDPELAIEGLSLLWDAGQLDRTTLSYVAPLLREGMSLGRPNATTYRAIQLYAKLVEGGGLSLSEQEAGLKTLVALLSNDDVDLNVRANSIMKLFVFRNNAALRAQVEDALDRFDGFQRSFLKTTSPRPTSELPPVWKSRLSEGLRCALQTAVRELGSAATIPTVSVPEGLPTTHPFTRWDFPPPMEDRWPGDPAPRGVGVPRDAYGVTSGRALPGGDGALKTDAKMSEGNSPVTQALLETLGEGAVEGTIEYAIISALHVIDWDGKSAFLLSQPLHHLVARHLEEYDYPLLGSIKVIDDALQQWSIVAQCMYSRSQLLALKKSVREDVTELLHGMNEIERHATQTFGRWVTEMNNYVGMALITAAQALVESENPEPGQTMAALLLHQAYRRFGVTRELHMQAQVARTFADLKKIYDRSTKQDAIYARIWEDVTARGEEGVRQLLHFVERSGDGYATYAIHMSLAQFYRTLGFGQVADYHESVAKDAEEMGVAIGSMEPNATSHLNHKIEHRAQRFAEDHQLKAPKPIPVGNR